MINDVAKARFAWMGLVACLAANAVAQEFDIPWRTIDGGGGYSAGGDFEVEGTIGQPDAGGPMTGGDFSLTGGFWPGSTVEDPPAEDVLIVDAQSILPHGDPAIDLSIDLDDSNGIEARLGGPARLSFEMDQDMDAGTVSTGNVQIACSIGPAPNLVEATLEGTRTVVVDIDAMSALDCCNFSFAGMLSTAGTAVADAYNIRRIGGDVDYSGAVTGGDASLIKPHFGEIVGIDLTHPKWDFDRNGGVTGGDFSLIKPRFGDVGTVCP